jgi:hypothetical protein
MLILVPLKENLTYPPKAFDNCSVKHSEIKITNIME